MTNQKETLPVHVVVNITPHALEAIVENVKQLVGRDEKGFYRVDTADKVGEIISQFLLEKNFENYVKDIKNYPS